MKRFSMITCLILPGKQIGAHVIDKRKLLSNNDGYGYERCIQAASTLSRLFHLVQLVKCCHFFWSWNLKDCIEVQEKKNKVFASPSPAPGRCLVSTFSTNREIRNFHVVVEQWRQRNVLKRSVMHVQGCCFANLNLLFFCRSRWCRGRRCLSSVRIRHLDWTGLNWNIESFFHWSPQSIMSLYMGPWFKSLTWVSS